MSTKTRNSGTNTKVDRAATNSKQRMYKAAQKVEGEGEQASKRIAGLIDKAAQDANTAATKSANNAKERVFKATREVETARTEALESIETALSEATQQAVEEATASSEEAAKQAEQNASASQRAVRGINDRLAEAQELLDNLRQVHGISTDVAIGGSHDKTAQEEREAADEWRKKSIKYRGWTAAAAVAYTVLNVLWPPDGWEWAFRSPIGASAVFILGWMSKYASDQSSAHRITANIYKHQSLAFASLRHYAQDIEQMSGGNGQHAYDDTCEDDHDEPNAAAGMFMGRIVESLFTNQIDAFTDQIRTTHRSERGWFRRQSAGE